MSASRHWVWIALAISIFVTGNILDQAAANFRVPGRFDFSPQKLQELKKSTLEGDKDAALQVAYYELFARSEYIDENIYWEQIASENDSPDAMKILAATLRLRGGRENCIRAVYWAKRASTDSKSVDMASDMKSFLSGLYESGPCKGIFK